MLRKILGLAVLAIVVAPVGSAFADTITFKDGREVNGKVIEEKRDYVMFKVLQGTMKIMKNRIATFTEDDDMGFKMVGKVRSTTPTETPKPGGDATKSTDSSDLTAEEKDAIAKKRAELKAEMDKLGKDSDTRMKEAELGPEERGLVQERLELLRSAAPKRRGIDFGAIDEMLNLLSTKAKGMKVLAGLFEERGTVQLMAAKGVGDIAGDPDAKWMAFKLEVPMKLLAVLESQGDELAGKAREVANASLERLTGKSVGWAPSDDSFRSQAEAEATARWRPIVTEQMMLWKSDEEKNDAKRKKAAEQLKTLDGPNWRDAFVEDDGKGGEKK